MPSPEPAPRIIPLDRIDAEPVGGKAAGLARLIRWNLEVPSGFVVTGASPGRLPEGLMDAYRELGAGAVAVRSSAHGEDGSSASFAGQYETFLNVEGESALQQAVEKCLRSLDDERARSYREQQSGSKGDSMSVVVQRMVPARSAGVLFTADPVSHRRDRVVVDAVSGLGESLVSGKATPDHFKLTRDGKVSERELENTDAVVSDQELRTLVSQAVEAERQHGGPLDMEWAIDHQGTLFWLQARPITTLESGIHEFDTPARPDEVFTRSNYGEMMPGVVDPLTYSTTLMGIDQGIQAMQLVCGARREKTDALQVTGLFSGHIFCNLTGMLPFCDNIGGSSPQQLALAICGREVPELGKGNPAPKPARLVNGLRYFGYILSAKRETARFEKKLKRFRIDLFDDPGRLYAEIDEKLAMLVETYEVHLQSSAVSAVTSNLLQQILQRKGGSLVQQEARIAALLAGSGNVESAVLVEELDDVVDRIASHPQASARFGEAGAEEALAWLKGPDSGLAGEVFGRFLSRHGHRAFRELSMRQPGWADDPLPLIRTMQVTLRGERKARTRDVRDAGSGRPGPAMRWLLDRSRKAVRGREYTKSILVEVTNRFKRAYRRLAGLLVEEGLLPDEDAVFFLTHQEIGRLIETRDQDLTRKALSRRKLVPLQEALVFSDLSVGPPIPLSDSADRLDESGTLNGRPASRGVARGKARVVRTLEEAAGLEPGEILIAPVTDVGWTPYFRLIAGLATDVGSAISHGAVVAREYGLPAVVNLKTATRVFQTGDEVELDGNRGTLRRVND